MEQRFEQEPTSAPVTTTEVRSPETAVTQEAHTVAPSRDTWNEDWESTFGGRSSRRWRRAARQRQEEELARRKIQGLDFDGLLGMLQQEAEARRKKRRKKLGGIALYLGILIGLPILIWLATGHFTFNTIGMIGSVGGMVAGMSAISQQHKIGTLALTEFDDIRAVGPLTEALDFEDKDVQGAATQKLILLLPKLKASDAALLSAEQRDLLVRALNGSNQELSLAILQALMQVGDEKALPAVQRLAQGEGRAQGNLALQQRAQACLPALTALIENRRAGAELLRAADGNQTPPEMLLRPVAADTTETDPALLLRAADTAYPPDPARQNTLESPLHVDISHI